jgi:hypothetical protein
MHTRSPRPRHPGLSQILALSLVGLSWCGSAHAVDISQPASSGRTVRAVVEHLRICAAFDLLHVTSIEDAGRVVLPDHDRLAARAIQVIAARRLCREGAFEQALDLYSRMPVEGASTRWLQ